MNTKPATLVRVLLELEPALADKEDISGEDLARWDMPIIGGCACCGATIAAYNACPGKNGLLIGTCCADEGNTLPLPQALDLYRQAGVQVALSRLGIEEPST